MSMFYMHDFLTLLQDIHYTGRNVSLTPDQKESLKQKRHLNSLYHCPTYWYKPVLLILAISFMMLYPPINHFYASFPQTVRHKRISFTEHRRARYNPRTKGHAYLVDKKQILI